MEHASDRCDAELQCCISSVLSMSRSLCLHSFRADIARHRGDAATLREALLNTCVLSLLGRIAEAVASACCHGSADERVAWHATLVGATTCNPTTPIFLGRDPPGKPGVNTGDACMFRHRAQAVRERVA